MHADLDGGGDCRARGKVVDLVGKQNIVVLEAVAIHVDPARRRSPRFTQLEMGLSLSMAGRRLDRRKMMASKLPAGL